MINGFTYKCIVSLGKVDAQASQERRHFLHHRGEDVIEKLTRICNFHICVDGFPAVQKPHKKLAESRLGLDPWGKVDWAWAPRELDKGNHKGNAGEQN